MSDSKKTDTEKKPQPTKTEDESSLGKTAANINDKSTSSGTTTPEQ
ncbi:MAG TPA: hypothetical protein VF704_14115 [Allosphingosinicella sp.]